MMSALKSADRYAPLGASAGRLIQTLARKSVDREPFVQSQAWGDAPGILQIIKSAVPAISEGSFPVNSVVADVLGTVRRQSAISQLIGVHRAPVGVRVIGIGSRPVAYLVSEGAPAPVTGASLTGVRLHPQKVVALTAVTNELLRATSQQAQQLVADLVLGAVAKAADEAFLAIDGAPTISSTGTSIAALDADLSTAVGTLATTGCDMKLAQWVVPAPLAARMALLRGSGGGPAYPDLRMDGGWLPGCLRSSPAPTRTPRPATPSV